MKTNKKLIEVALPLDAINKASAREKSIRHGYTSTLRLWSPQRSMEILRQENHDDHSRLTGAVAGQRESKQMKRCKRASLFMSML